MKSEIRNVAEVAISASHFALRCAAASSPRRNSARISAASAGMISVMERRLSISSAPPPSVIQVTSTAIPITMAKA